jgi:hypothetical protein
MPADCIPRIPDPPLPNARNEYLPSPPSSDAIKAKELGVNVVSYCNENNVNSPFLPTVIDVLLKDDVNITMRKIIQKILQDKACRIEGMINSLPPPTHYEDFKETFNSVVYHMLTSPVTWGRIATAYAFGGLLAKATIASSPEASRAELDLNQFGVIVGEVIFELAGHWIAAQGGWNDGFVNCFSPINSEETTTRILLYGFGAFMGLTLLLFKFSH